MTRQRIGLSLLYTVTSECPQCNGLGRVRSLDATLTELENWFKRFRGKAKDRRLRVDLHPDMVKHIYETKSKVISGFMWKNWMLIEVKKNSDVNLDSFRVYSKKRRKDVTDEV